MASSRMYSTRYYQLSSEILMEYNYTNVDEVTNNQSGDVSEYMYDLCNDNTGYIVDSKYNSSRNFLLDTYKANFVLPINYSESKFTQCVNVNRYGTETCIWNNLITGDIKATELTPTQNQGDIIKDRFKIHFTSRNYLGDYDGFILRMTIYDNAKNQIGIFSHYIKKTDDLEVNQDPILINQKLYTTYLEFDVPSVNGILNQQLLAGESYLKGKLGTSYSIMSNTPIIISIYGVKATYEYNQFECYKTEKLNTIYIPVNDTYSKLSISVEESSDGDYFEIYPEVEGDISFSDYITDLSNDYPESYVIMHEISLTEYYTDNFNNVHSDVSHRSHYIVSATADEDELNRHIIYRPVLQHSGRLASIIIEDQMKIINTVDNTTTVKVGTYKSSEYNGFNPKKYGKKLNKIYMGNIPAQVNVYNKRPDSETDSVNITNGGSNVTIENHQHSIIGFIECANVGVSIEQIPASILNE